jgi:hypothetical protein
VLWEWWGASSATADTVKLGRDGLGSGGDGAVVSSKKAANNKQVLCTEYTNKLANMEADDQQQQDQQQDQQQQANISSMAGGSSKKVANKSVNKMVSRIAINSIGGEVQ